MTTTITFQIQTAKMNIANTEDENSHVVDKGVGEKREPWMMTQSRKTKEQHIIITQSRKSKKWDIISATVKL